MERDVVLSSETVLPLAPGIRTRLDAAGHVLVDAPDGTIIATLSLFAPTVTLSDAIERLEQDKGSSTTPRIASAPTRGACHAPTWKVASLA
jgi:hypothetical protein